MVTVSSGNPINVGVIGMGGFAGEHHAALQQLESSGLCKLVCTCDPKLGDFGSKISDWHLQERGVQVYMDYRDMLESCHTQLDMVTIPTPVPLHAEMHAAAIRHRLAVYLEKPPTLNPAEFKQMLEVEGNAVKATNVGFNFIIEQPRQDLKRRLLQGDFGGLRKVLFSGLWPRPRQYYTRTDWAGRLQLNNKLVLDSCIGNAMAHYVHNALYWAGPHSVHTWADVTQVRAEMYRAHAIEGADTVFIIGKTSEGVEVQIAATHACKGDQYHYEQLLCEKATITYVTNHDYHIDWNNGTSERIPVKPVSVSDNLTAYLAYLSGKVDRPPTYLKDSQAFITLNALAYIASGIIQAVPSRYISTSTEGTSSQDYVAIGDIDEVFSRFFRHSLFPSEQHVAWSHAGGVSSSADIPRLPDVISEMLRQNGRNAC